MKVTMASLYFVGAFSGAISMFNHREDYWVVLGAVIMWLNLSAAINKLIEALK